MTGSVQLKGEQSGTAVLYRVLDKAIAAFPDDLGGLLPPDTAAFRKSYPQVLPRFEATRLSCPNRHAIARLLANEMLDQLVWRTDSTESDESLQTYLQTEGADGMPLPLETHAVSGSAWQATFDYGGRYWPLESFASLGEHLLGRTVVSADAASGLAWLASNCRDGIDLRGRRIVVMGASAEMAPTSHLLAAGADVLWLDVVPPSDGFLAAMEGGTLYWPASGADLLTQPREVLATINAFAGDDAVDLALYAYAPGRAREVRLTGAMNAIAGALPAGRVRSVAMLVSPTTPTALDARDLEAMSGRLAARPAWEAALASARLLGRDGAERVGSSATTRTVVGIQGSSYQAAQYLGKVIAAECWAAHGPPHVDTATPLRVSANTAAITKTRSLEHPVFDAAFGGAAAFGVETFSPAQSRQLNGALAMKDWLDDAIPEPGRVRVHGGIHTLPYPLESAMLSAAAIGFARRPSLLAGLLKR